MERKITTSKIPFRLAINCRLRFASDKELSFSSTYTITLRTNETQRNGNHRDTKNKTIRIQILSDFNWRFLMLQRMRSSVDFVSCTIVDAIVAQVFFTSWYNTKLDIQRNIVPVTITRLMPMYVILKK